MKIIEKIKNWRCGSYIPPTTAELFDQPIPTGGHFKPPIVVRAINGIGSFFQKNWKWIIRTILIVIGLYIAWRQLLTVIIKQKQ